MKRLIFTILFVLILQAGAFAQSYEFKLGMELARNGNFQNALSHFQKSIQANLSRQKLEQIHYNIGVCYYRLKQADAAVIEFEKAVALNPKYEKAFYALGMAHSDLQNWNEAETAFRQSLKLSNNGETWFDMAFVYVEQKKYDDAASSFQKAIDFGSQSVGASHNNLGVIYATKGDYQMANKEIKTAKSLGFSEAENNLEILRKVMNSNDKTLIAKLILKEKNNER